MGGWIRENCCVYVNGGERCAKVFMFEGVLLIFKLMDIVSFDFIFSAAARLIF